MLDRLTARAHGIRIFVEPCLHCLDNLLVLPTRDATLPSRRAQSFDWAGSSRMGPITVKFLAVLLGRIAPARLDPGCHGCRELVLRHVLPRRSN
jgi:hypothetical protein